MIEGVPGPQLPETLKKRLDSDERPLGHGPLDEALALIEQIVRRQGFSPDGLDHKGTAADRRDPRLARLAEMSMRYFSALLFIVQRRDSGDVR